MAQTSEHARHIAKNATVVGGATLASRMLGFARDLVIAFALGAGPLSDAFFVAFRVPNLLRRLFGEGALTMAFIPVFTRVKAERGLDAAYAMARSAFVWQGAVLGVLTLLAVAGAEYITFIIAPGFKADPELFATAAALTRICFPYVVFICAVALAMGILNSQGHFLSPALAPCILNVVLITAALAAVVSNGFVPEWLAWGVFAAGLAQLAFQLPFLHKAGYRFRGPFSLRDADVAKVAKLMGPSVFGAAVYQFGVVGGTMLASFLPFGSVSYLYYADRLVEFPLGVFGLAVSTAAMPHLASLAANGKDEEFLSAVGSALKLTLFISLPAAAGLAALGASIVATLFGHGEFGAHDVSATSMALSALCVGLPATSVARPMVAAFYARQDTLTPVKIAAVSLVANLATGAVFMQFLNHVGLALGLSVGSWVNALLLAQALERKVGNFGGVTRKAAIFAALAGCMGVAAWWSTRLGPWCLALIPVLAGLYFGLAMLFGLSEAGLLWSAVAGRIRRRRTHQT